MSKLNNSVVENSTTDTINMSDLSKLISPYIVELKDFIKLGDTPFRLNAFNGVYAPAKAGKSYFVLEQLNTLDPKYTVIWLDGDRNAELKDKFENIKHCPVSRTSELIDTLTHSNNRLDNYIVIIDSFKDFSLGHDTDSNSGCQKIFMKYQELLDKGATLVIIFHSTKLRDGNGNSFDFKIKGNEDVIESKMDFMYKLERIDNGVRLIVQCARDEALPKGKPIFLTDINILKQNIIKAVNENPNISLRELKKVKGLSPYSQEIDNLKGTLYLIEKTKNEGKKGQPRQVVKLI
ncbi:MAG: Unknown protein [uncultured Campylobacterales bacterium]|uniref:Uncharacterized protein n=1 Tax=uncultured Campylobacterales bacterium TaxID=352960 RepID=A0A6S6S4V2_9BACT|nr:MAG: Unknown protein [uncultured Campylobacterales bacterium]